VQTANGLRALNTMSEKLSVRRAADRLDIEPWRALRLSRFLALDAYESVIPGEEVDELALIADSADRYNALREWLLTHMRLSH
jgi:hypothetical protein